MVYVSTCICVILFLIWSGIFIKTYQLFAYNIKNFLISVFEFHLANGDKSKFVFTKRMCRFLFLYAIISFAIFFVINYFTKSIPLIIINYILIFILSPAIIVAVHYIISPLEILIKKFYISKATKKLEKLNIIKIGITGSYGKTSTKNILATILEKEYKVCVSPQNYNTEMGLTKTILENLDDHDVIIAEMGARHIGDIKSLTKIIKPQYGILTTIGNQHLETFKTLENIENTKNELPLSIPENGIMVFNGDSQSGIKLYKNYKGNKYLSCCEDGYSYAKNIITDDSGSRFDMILDKDILHIETKLLGKCNINNIVTASTLAHLLGISNNDIVSAVKSLLPSPHRLELIKNNYFTIIDDSYNSNIIGAKEALETLSKFQGSKIVVTPGLVEMGEEQSDVNFKLGTMIADVADYIIIMNETNKNYILSGAISHNFDREKIYFCSSRKRQKELLQLLTNKGCVVLFENDLPDNYK